MKLTRPSKFWALLTVLALLAGLLVERRYDEAAAAASAEPGLGGSEIENQVAPPSAANGTLVFECFDTQGGADPNVPVRLTTRNFGNDTVIVRKAMRMCEPALKSSFDVAGEIDLFQNARVHFFFSEPIALTTQVDMEGSASIRAPVSPVGDVDKDGLDDIQAQLVTLSIHSIAPVQLTLNPSSPGGAKITGFFDVFLEMAAPVNGTIEELKQVVKGKLDSPAGITYEDFFDITYFVLAPHSPSSNPDDASSVALHSPTPLHLQGIVSALPPAPGDALVATIDGPLPQLLYPGGQPSGISVAPVPASFHLDTPTTGPAVTRVFQCYRLEKGADPNDPYLLHTANFGDDRVIVRNATMMCEGALKSLTPLAGVDPPSAAWECFNIANGTNPGKNFRLTTQNFGDDRVTVRKAVMLCEEAIKVRIDAAGNPTNASVGQPTGRVFECYSIQGKDPKAAFSLRTRNFGADSIVVRKASLMCEPAKKTPLGGFPPFEDTQPTSEPAGG